MKIIRLISFITLFLVSFLVNAQSDGFNKSMSAKTNFMIGFYHVGGYGKENPILYLEQHFDYRFHPKFSVGGGLGINLYPALLATPVFVHGKYHFKIKSINAYLHQSYGRNIKTFDFSFKSNRYLGSIGTEFKLGEQLRMSTELGYSFIWDKYGGASITTFVGVGLKYKIGKK